MPEHPLIRARAGLAPSVAVDILESLQIPFSRLALSFVVEALDV
jgi:hypothetical protein